MWLDSASKIDMLFYKPYAKLVEEIIENKLMNPLTIGIYGNWGAGKSTLLELIDKELHCSSKKIVTIRLNSWMFEGYEDAKIALMESLLLSIKENNTIYEKVKGNIDNLLKRIRYMKVAVDAIKNYGIPFLTSIAMQNPTPVISKVAVDIADKGGIVKTAEHIKEEYLKEDKEDVTENIRKFKKEFEDMIISSEIDNLVVMIDDLDRCSPSRIIDTLEAIKLFLSVKKTTFILAVDEDVIRYAVENKYPKIDNMKTIVSESYIEKIIQLPIKLPKLSEKDLKNYLLLLVCELYVEDNFNKFLEKVYMEGFLIADNKMTFSQIDKLLIDLNINVNSSLKDNFTTDNKIIESISDIIAYTLDGNPRQAKRFLNTYIVRRKLARLYFGNDKVDDKVLAKLLVLERIDDVMYKKLYNWYRLNDKKLIKLKDIVEKIQSDQELDSEDARWQSPKLKAWLEVEPVDIYEKNLDAYFYLSREKIQNIDGDIFDILSVTEKIIVEKFLNSQPVEVDKITEEIKVLSAIPKNNVLSAILRKFEIQEFEMRKITYIYKEFPEVREDICNIINDIYNNFSMIDVLQIKLMKEHDNTIIDPYISKWIKNGLLKKETEKVINGGKL